MASETSGQAAATLRRRKLRFESYEEVVAEARRLHEREYRRLGNWTLGRALGHLGNAMQGSVDGGTFRVPWWMKVVGRIYLKRRMTRRDFPPGFRLPRRAEAVLVPEQTISFEEGLARLEAGVARLRSTDQRGAHPVLGPLTVAEWEGFHLRHAELHLSFFVPIDEGGKS